jgi:pyruvate formate lyase activating enzyme
MKICGLQKLTLLDYPGRVACTVFLGGCNFRCPWCHNGDIAMGQPLEKHSKADFIDFLGCRRKKLDGVAITGGEPCLNDDLPEFLDEIKALGYSVKLDTNGTRPTMLKFLIENHLVDYVAMDIKNKPAKYSETTGVLYPHFMNVRRSVELLKKGLVSYEFRTTVIDEFHQPEDFIVIGEWLQGPSPYYLQVFVDSPEVPHAGFHAPSDQKLAECLMTVKKYLPNASVRGVVLKEGE